MNCSSGATSISSGQSGHVRELTSALLPGTAGSPTRARSTTPASAAMNAGSSFMRRASAPARGRARRAFSRASISRSQRISRWSETKPTGATSTLRDALAVQPLELVEDVRPEPRLAGRARALEGERPALAEARALGDEARGLEQLLAVGVAVGQDPLRQRVRREDDPGVGSADAGGDHVHEGRVVVPALDQHELGLAAVQRRLEPLAVLADRHAARSAAPARRRSAASPRRRARASTASAIRGCQCFIPTKTGIPSSRSSAARCASVTSSSGERPPIRR